MRYPPPPTKFGAMPAQPKQQAAARRGPAPPPTRYGASVTQASTGRSLDRPGLPSNRVAQPCWAWFSSLFSKKPSEPKIGYQEIPDDQVSLTITKPSSIGAKVERINEDVLRDQDNVASRAYPLNAAGQYFFGNISGCTIVYARGDTHGSAAHFFGQTCDDGLKRELVRNFTEVGDTIRAVKVFFSSEGKQKNFAVLTDGQRGFETKIKQIAPRATFIFHIYLAHDTTIMLNAAGGYVVDVSNEVTVAK